MVQDSFQHHKTSPEKAMRAYTAEAIIHCATLVCIPPCAKSSHQPHRVERWLWNLGWGEGGGNREKGDYRVRPLKIPTSAALATLEDGFESAQGPAAERG